MLINRQFNTFSYDEYFHHIKNHKDYDDFKTLGLYRSIIENENLDLDQKIAVRDFAHTFFAKFFEFLQVKDPHTYFGIMTLDQELTIEEIWQLSLNNRANVSKILNAKGIKHSNFGIYSVNGCKEGTCWCGGYWMKKTSKDGGSYILTNYTERKTHLRGRLKAEKEVKATRKFRDKLREIPIED